MLRARIAGITGQDGRYLAGLLCARAMPSFDWSGTRAHEADYLLSNGEIEPMKRTLN
jgi:GDP-D-mannose dehydratase